MERVPGLYASCPMGGFQNTYVREIVQEILGRYDLDCVKFGGGSFGFSRSVCYCPACREGFARSRGLALPAGPDWGSRLWRTYTSWRLEQARQRVHQLGEIVHSVDPTMPFMGNSVCFGDPGWTVSAALDVEHQAAVADAVQVEVQTRGRYDETSAETEWQYLSWPAETARFMTSVSDTPIWVVASYFLAWPWIENWQTRNSLRSHATERLSRNAATKRRLRSDGIPARTRRVTCIGKRPGTRGRRTW